jgi:release factor glutamine methyltransferase
VIVDVGTGSGCIAVALATEFPNARLIASDVSLAALSVARRNGARHGAAQRIAFVHTNLFNPETDVDLIVSNPPYIPIGDAPSLAPEVRDYEPPVALFGGTDGLDAYRAIFTTNETSLSVGGEGRLIVEVGYDQAAAVKALAAPRVWTFERGYRDLQGIERVLVFKAKKR